MLKKFIKSYNDGKIAFVEKMTDSKEGIYDELSFLDDGYIISKINRLKKENKDIQNQLNMLEKYDDDFKNNYAKQQELSNRLKEIRFEIAFLASNNMDNIDSCLDLIKGSNSDFELCLTGLKYYKEGNMESSFDYFYKYFKDKNIILEHYLINKIYGIIMFNMKQFEISAKLLRKAAEKRPEDLQVHNVLREIYINTKNEAGLLAENTIIKLLGT